MNADYNHWVDFGRYHTYSWIRAEGGNQLWADRIRRGVDSELRQQGRQEVPSGRDAAVAAIGAARQHQQLQTFYVGVGGW